MRKRFSREMSKILVMALVLGTVTLPATSPTYAAEAPIQIDKFTTQTEQNVLDRVSNVTLSVKGTVADVKAAANDVVLVLDVSGSMGVASTSVNRIAPLQSASKSFIDKLSTASPDTRFAVVIYNASAKVKQPFTKDKNLLNAAIDSLDDGVDFINDGVDTTIVSQAQVYGGTNMESGLLLAKSLLLYKSRDNVDKSVLFMSDGEPTNYLDKNFEGGYQLLEDSANSSYKIWHKLCTRINEVWTAGGNWLDVRYRGNHCSGINGLGSTYDATANEKAQIQADEMKAAGVKIFTVGLAVTTENGISTLTHLASAATDYYSTTITADLNLIYQKIANRLVLPVAGWEPTITDVVPERFAFNGTVSSFVKKVNGIPVALVTDEVTLSGKTLTWHLSKVAVGDTVTLSYTVRTDAMGNAYGAVYTNSNATIDYKRYDQFSQLQTMPELTFAQPSALVTPIGTDDVYLFPVNSPQTISAAAGVKINDSFEQMNEGRYWNFSDVTVAPNTNAQHGTVALNADGSFTYQPTPGYLGTDNFTYQLVLTGTNVLTAQKMKMASRPVNVALTIGTNPIVEGLKITDKYGNSRFSCPSKFPFVVKMSFKLLRPTRGKMEFTFANTSIPKAALAEVSLYKGAVKQTLKPTLSNTTVTDCTVTVPAQTATGIAAGDYTLIFKINDRLIPHTAVPSSYTWKVSSIEVYEKADLLRGTNVGGGIALQDSSAQITVRTTPRIQ